MNQNIIPYSTEETNINNINYNNNNNNIKDFNYNRCVPSDTTPGITSLSPAGASGLASLSSGNSFSSGLGNPAEEILPRNWRGLKIDLFDNSGNRDHSLLKLGISVIKSDGTTQNLRAHMNSPNRYIWRGVEPVDSINNHWSLVKEIQQEFKLNEIKYNCSKFSLPNKGKGTEIVGFLAEADDQWLVILILNARRFEYWLNKSGTTSQSQRNGNIIASKFIGKNRQPLLSLEELGL
jgi:hypothetical protein